MEDSWYAAPSDSTDGKFHAHQLSTLMQINPSYGVLSRITENAEETEVTTTKAVVYVNGDPKQNTENVQKTEAATTKALRYVNNPTVVAEEYEYMNVSRSSTDQPQISKKQQLTYNDSELSNEYEINYI